MAGAALVMWQSSVGERRKTTGGRPPPPSPAPEKLEGSATLAGDLVVAAGAFSGAGFLVLAKRIRDEVELSHLIVLQMLVNLPLTVALASAFEGVSFANPLDPSTGIFGWLTEEQIGKQLVISVCGTLIGTAGYVASLKYLVPTVVAIVMLLEPILATLMGFAAGVNPFPELRTCFGMGLVFCGTAVMAVDAGRTRTRAVDVDAHRRSAARGKRPFRT